MIKINKKTLFFPIFLVIFLIFTSILFVGCGKKIPEPERIELPMQTIEMWKGKSLYLTYNVYPKAASCQLYLTTTDEDIITIASQGRITAKNYGEADVTIHIANTNISDTCHVIVNDGDIVNVYDLPSIKTNYFENEPIDKNSIVLSGTALYESGVEKQVTNKDFEILCPEKATKGANIVIKCQKWTKSYPLTIIEDTPVKVSVKNMPTSTNVKIGEVFDPSGLVLEVEYRSGRKEETEDFTFDTTPIAIGQKTVEVYCQDFEPILINIKAVAEKTVSSFSELQNAINANAKTIEITARITTNTSLVINGAQNMTIFGQPTTQFKPALIAKGVAPLTIKGEVKNLKIMGLELDRQSLVATANRQKTILSLNPLNFNVLKFAQSPSVISNENIGLVDVRECHAQSDITFENVTFSLPKEECIINSSEVQISINFVSCIFREKE